MEEKVIHNPYAAGIMAISAVAVFAGTVTIATDDSWSPGFTVQEWVGLGLIGIGVHAAIVLLGVLAVRWWHNQR
ncbi:hypothetical protein [Haloechinothrix salitolerans]|uniref:Uncharacterized protein n=1 Tax=Haloechinothrix salitolerans TaxID=926830 RepID=A0ABW2C874_9PSEU